MQHQKVKWVGWGWVTHNATRKMAKWQKKKHENNNNFHKKPLDISRYSCQKEQRWFKSSLLVRSLFKILFCFHLQKTELFIVCWMGPVSHCTLCEKLQNAIINYIKTWIFFYQYLKWCMLMQKLYNILLRNGFAVQLLVRPRPLDFRHFVGLRLRDEAGSGKPGSVISDVFWWWIFWFWTCVDFLYLLTSLLLVLS